MSIHDTLASIQAKLAAPKGQRNEFGKYDYRSCEDILHALKPLLAEHGACVVLHNTMVTVGGKIYVEATATLHCGGERISVTGHAREADAKKGMDEAQITGATCSYARKYALAGLFAIDNEKDSDSTNTHGANDKTEAPKVVSQANDMKARFASVEARLTKSMGADEFKRILDECKSKHTANGAIDYKSVLVELEGMK